MLESILGNLGNLEEMATKLGIPADKLSSLTETLQGKLGQGGDQMTALMEAAQEHGLPLDKLQGMLGGLGEGAGGIMGKVTGMLDQDGDGNPVNDLMGMAKGLFGKD
jgi:hypothetical protein